MSDPSSWLTAQRRTTAAAVRTAESPAEAVLLVHLLMARDGDGYAVGGAGCSWRLETQHKVTVERATYRLDIALFRGPHRVCVEVDGHAYHHANDEQEARDAARDFALRATGWTIIRVEAWKAFANPSAVVEDLVGRLQEIERVGVRKPVVPIEDQTDEQFADTIAIFEAVIRKYPESAEENANRIWEMRARRDKVRVVKALQKRERSGSNADAEKENELLRALFKSRRERLGIEAA